MSGEESPMELTLAAEKQPITKEYTQFLVDPKETLSRFSKGLELRAENYVECDFTTERVKCRDPPKLKLEHIKDALPVLDLGDMQFERSNPFSDVVEKMIAEGLHKKGALVIKTSGPEIFTGKTEIALLEEVAKQKVYVKTLSTRLILEKVSKNKLRGSTCRVGNKRGPKSKTQPELIDLEPDDANSVELVSQSEDDKRRHSRRMPPSKTKKVVSRNSTPDPDSSDSEEECIEKWKFLGYFYFKYEQPDVVSLQVREFVDKQTSTVLKLARQLGKNVTNDTIRWDSLLDAINFFYELVDIGTHQYVNNLRATLMHEEFAGTWLSDAIKNILTRSMRDLADGVTNSLIYVGGPVTSFPLHKEDHKAGSWNILYAGAPKVWVIIAARYEQALFNMLITKCKLDEKRHTSCADIISHKDVFLHPTELDKVSIPYSVHPQQPGEMMLTEYGSHHFGFNMGYNISEAVNFATPSWMDHGLTTRHCLWDAKTKFYKNMREEMKHEREDKYIDYLKGNYQIENSKILHEKGPVETFLGPYKNFMLCKARLQSLKHQPGHPESVVLLRELAYFTVEVEDYLDEYFEILDLIREIMIGKPTDANILEYSAVIFTNLVRKRAEKFSNINYGNTLHKACGNFFALLGDYQKDQNGTGNSVLYHLVEFFLVLRKKELCKDLVHTADYDSVVNKSLFALNEELAYDTDMFLRSPLNLEELQQTCGTDREFFYLHLFNLVNMAIRTGFFYEELTRKWIEENKSELIELAYKAIEVYGKIREFHYLLRNYGKLLGLISETDPDDDADDDADDDEEMSDTNADDPMMAIMT